MPSSKTPRVAAAAGRRPRSRRPRCRSAGSWPPAASTCRCGAGGRRAEASGPGMPKFGAGGAPCRRVLLHQSAAASTSGRRDADVVEPVARMRRHHNCATRMRTPLDRVLADRGVDLAAQPITRRSDGRHVPGDHSVRVARPADDRRCGRRAARSTGTRSSSTSRRPTSSPRSTRTSRSRVPDATDAARARARAARLRAALLEPHRAARGASPSSSTTSSGPTPQSKLLPAVLDALEAAGVTDACVICANGKVFPMSESDIEQKIGRDNLGPHGAHGDAVPPERAAQRRGLLVRRRVLARDAGLAVIARWRGAT